MNVERVREILGPEYREDYDGMETINEACQMGRDALRKLVPLRPYLDDGKNIMACPRCGSSEYLHNEDGNEQNFCGQRGQAIEWRQAMKNFKEKKGGSQFNFLDEIIVDNFAGGGGASISMELATGHPVVIAINHNPDTILIYRINHPYMEHLQVSVWDVDSRGVCRGRPVGPAWLSPDCKYFFKIEGVALVDRNIRGLAWIVSRWAGIVRPRVTILENAEEFVTWGLV